MIDWLALASRLGGASADSPDDAIDAALDQLHGSDASAVDAVATGVLVACLRDARSHSTRRDVAHALATYVPAPSVETAVDALTEAYMADRAHAVLGPEMLTALATLGERAPVARVATSAALLRITDGDTSFLRVRAAKVIGRLEGLGLPTEGRAILEQWIDAPEPSVEAEARFQLALLDLIESLREPDLVSLERRMRLARVGLVRAELSEELRLDARQLIALVDVLLQYLSYRDGALDVVQRATALRTTAEALKALIDDPTVRPWAGLTSPHEAAIEFRLYRVAASFLRLAASLEIAEEWTNLDAALVEVAAAVHLSTTPAPADPRLGSQRPAAIASTLGAMVPASVPVLGPLLRRVVGRVRFNRVIEHYEASHGRDATADTLHRVYTAVSAEDFTASASGGHRDSNGVSAGSHDAATALRELAVAAPALVADLFDASPELVPALERVAGTALHVRSVTGDGAAGSTPLEGLLALAVDAPACYGDDPGVDDAVRPTLVAIRRRRGRRLVGAKWRRVESAVVSIIRIARHLRDNPMPFTLCEAAGGTGQSAGEGDLQSYLFERLERDFGRFVQNEVGPNSGGRPDLALHFPEVHIPIEVKAEYHRIDDEHVRNHYLGQVDQYATGRDGVAALMILDLRASNPSGRRRRASAARIQRYSLREGFRVFDVPPDPQLSDTSPNAVVVGLVPGNLPRPSLLTTYSRRPPRN